MQQRTLHNSRYGMAVPSPAERRIELRQVTSIRWTDLTDALRRVIDGIRMDRDDEPELSTSPGTLTAAPAGGTEGCPAEGWIRSPG